MLGEILGAKINCSAEDHINVTHYHNKTCYDSGQNTPSYVILSAIVSACGVLSLLGSLFIIITFSYFKKLQVPTLRLVLFLAITDFLSTFDYVTSPVMPWDPKTCEVFPMCHVQAISGQFAELSRIFWVSCIAYNLYAIAVRGMKERQVDRLQIIYHVVSWGIPAVTVILMEAFQMVSPAGIWCWIDEDFTLARLFMLYMWLVVAIVFVFACYIHVCFAVRGMPTQGVIVRLQW